MQRTIRQLFKGRAVTEGAGVKLRRLFSDFEAELFDPFLMLDDFRSDNPEDFLAGFPWHPHRGIETITYVTLGDVEHGDSLGNKGVITTGAVQWMTAGSGVIPPGDAQGRQPGPHARLPALGQPPGPRQDDGPALPRHHRRRHPRGPTAGRHDHQGHRRDPGRLARAHGGDRHRSRVPGLRLASGHRLPASPPSPGIPCSSTSSAAAPRSTAGPWPTATSSFFSDGSQLLVQSGDAGVRFLFLSGAPLREPIAWRGPIVMNTREELDVAFEEYRNGTFIKHAPEGKA